MTTPHGAESNKVSKRAVTVIILSVVQVIALKRAQLFINLILLE
jgi:hypothetical protein